MSEWQKDRDRIARVEALRDDRTVDLSDWSNAVCDLGHDALKRWIAALDRIAELEKEAGKRKAVFDFGTDVAVARAIHETRWTDWDTIEDDERDQYLEYARAAMWVIMPMLDRAAAARDAAYARGFEAAKKAAVEAVQSVAYITANGARPYADREDAVTAIRAVKTGEGKPPDPSPELVERVARSSYEAWEGYAETKGVPLNGEPEWADLDEFWRGIWIATARAAIKAMEGCK